MTLPPKALAQHDRGGADAGCAAMHEHPIAALHMRAHHQMLPHGEECLGDRGGFNHRQRWRHFERMVFVSQAILRIASGNDERTDLVADLEARHAIADRDDFAGDLETGNIPCALRRRIAALALAHVRRFTPAAATFTRISPAPGVGTGRSSGTSISGPPGSLMPITVMRAGSDVIAVNSWSGNGGDGFA